MKESEMPEDNLLLSDIVYGTISTALNKVNSIEKSIEQLTHQLEIAKEEAGSIFLTIMDLKGIDSSKYHFKLSHETKELILKKKEQNI